MQRLHLFPSKVYTIREFWDLVPFMCYDVLTEKYGGQYGCFSTKNFTTFLSKTDFSFEL